MVLAVLVSFNEFIDASSPSSDTKYDALLTFMIEFAAKADRVPRKTVLCDTLVRLPPRFTDLCDGLLELGGYERTLPDIKTIIEIMQVHKQVSK